MTLIKTNAANSYSYENLPTLTAGKEEALPFCPRLYLIDDKRELNAVVRPVGFVDLLVRVNHHLDLICADFEFDLKNGFSGNLPGPKTNVLPMLLSLLLFSTREKY